MPYIKRCYLIIFCLIFTFTSYAAANFENQHLINYFFLGQLSKGLASKALQKNPPLNTLSATYDLNLYKITYKTTAPDGSLTIASGLVAMPIAPNQKAAIVSYQHGTRVLRQDVPSNPAEKDGLVLAIFGSSAGCMTVMPDYLGLGDNDLFLHPYVQADTLASSNVDMLLAAKELAQHLNYPLSEQLFLAGYSEGGFSTLVMFELLVKKYPEISVTAVALGSAPYDWQETMRFVMLEPGPRATVYLAYFFYSLQIYKKYWTNLDEIFVQPYNNLIPAIFDGSHTLPEILQTLPLQPKLIFQASFYHAILNDEDKNIEQLKKEFNHYYFTPSAPLLMVGTKGDKDVPYRGAEIAYKEFKNRSDKVYLKSVSDVFDHIEAQPWVLKEQLLFFQKNFKK